MQLVFHHDEDGRYCGFSTADESPLEPGVWLVPAGATLAGPLDGAPMADQVWNGSAWIISPVPPPPPPPVPTLIEAKAAKLLELQAAKNAEQDAGFMVGDVRFDSDHRARTAYLELAMMLAAEPSYSTAWKASDSPETWVTMDAALFAEVRAAGAAHVASCFARRHALAQQVEAAQTAGEVAAVEW